jgi:hypothetical protein
MQKNEAVGGASIKESERNQEQLVTETHSTRKRMIFLEEKK